MASQVELEFRKAVADLDALRVRWALIGGLAISVRSAPRFTKDLDFAVAVADDSEAEDVVHRLRGRAATRPPKSSSRATRNGCRAPDWAHPGAGAGAGLAGGGPSPGRCA